MRHQVSPSETAAARTDDFFRSRLDQMIDLRHPLVRLCEVMPWTVLERELSGVLPPAPAGAGRPALPLRMVIGLLYLKHAYNLSDEQVCARWLENPYWQFFCGEAIFQTRFPCDPSSLTRFRNRLGEAGVEELLAQTIEAAKDLKAVRNADLEQIVIDSTVQEKHVAYPTDSRLLELARHKLVKAAKAEGIALRQSYARIGPALKFKAGRYAHAKQFKRMRRTLKSQRTLLGRLIRELHRKASSEQMQRLAVLLERAERIRIQKPKDKHKLYALHAPEVECIGKGKARQPYEFGVKVGIAVTAKKGLVIGARSFPGNPYDGDTLDEHLEQTAILTGVVPKTAIVDLGYRGRQPEHITVVHRGKKKTLPPPQIRLLKRRQAVEPTIGHLKDGHRMRRCFLKGQMGDALNVVLAAAGYNIRWLMRWIVSSWAKILSLLISHWREAEAIAPHQRLSSQPHATVA